MTDNPVIGICAQCLEHLRMCDDHVFYATLCCKYIKHGVIQATFSQSVYRDLERAGYVLIHETDKGYLIKPLGYEKIPSMTSGHHEFHTFCINRSEHCSEPGYFDSTTQDIFE